MVVACFFTLFADDAVVDVSDSSGFFPSVAVRANDTTLFVDTLLAEDSLKEEQEEDSALAAEVTADTSIPPRAMIEDTLGTGISFESTFEKTEPSGNGLYPGISIAQDSMSEDLVQKIWSFQWDAVKKAGRAMQKLERKERLPPLSSLLLLSGCIVRLQNGDFSGKRSERQCRDEIEKIAKMGLSLSDPKRSTDFVRATNLMIYGGIRGILATLQINHNPVAAGIEGLNALDFLEKSVAINPSLKDAYLGLGIFYCALSKASLVVRGALNLIKRPVSLEKGLFYLRQSAYYGRYTNVMARLYLIQFLSPYNGNQANEKKRIFGYLESSFPANPYFLFLRLEENLCFHPEKAFDPSIRRSLRKKIVSFGDDEYTIARYRNLVKWQYKLIDPFAAASLLPDTTFPLKEFAYYPVFLSALREKYAVPQSELTSPEIRRHRTALIRKIESHVLKLLLSSSMSQSWRGFYAWHVRDALRMGN